VVCPLQHTGRFARPLTVAFILNPVKRRGQNVSKRPAASAARRAEGEAMGAFNMQVVDAECLPQAQNLDVFAPPRLDHP
jgi:hypothetical protein